MFKLNIRTKAHATRALMKCTSLARRRERYRLRYLAKLFSIPEDTPVRYVLDQPVVLKKKKGPGSKHWMSRMKDLLGAHEVLNTAYESLVEAATEHAGVIPEGPVDREDGLSNPLQDFQLLVEDWMWKTEAEGMSKAGEQARSTIQLMARGLRGVKWPYKIRLSRYPNKGANQVRLRCLAGTSALHSTLGKYRDRPTMCPHSGCSEDESTVHFCSTCPAYASQRAQYM